MKPLTWNELADWYDKHHSGSRPARTLPMDTVFDKCMASGKFVLNEDDDTISFKPELV